MQLLKYIPFHLLICLVTGIIVGFYVDIPLLLVATLLIGSLFILTLFFVLSKNNPRLLSLYNVSTFLTFFCIGMATISFQDDVKKQYHYTSFLSEKDGSQMILKVSTRLKPNPFYSKYEAEVLQIDGKQAQGRLLVNIKLDSLNKSIRIDDKLVVHTVLSEIEPPKNPYQFNYKNYLEHRQIYKQINISDNHFVKLEMGKMTLRGLADAFRRKTNETLMKSKFSKDELGVVNALLLGQRQEISNELLQDYANAGAIHLLAVSGLHVGIIMLLLNLLLSPLKRFRKGKIIRLLLIVVLLWVFAFIAGLSASVIRAVAMFTAVSIGLVIERKNSVYKNLIISMLFLLLLNPYYLFEIGFQLSYLAVFFIVWLQPIVYGLWKPSWKFIDYFWQLFTVSLAAQIGVLPLSLYYFHQFPGLFFVANLIIIPILGFVLGLGIVIIFLGWMRITPPLLLDLFIEIISTMNGVISWIAAQKNFVFQDISFSISLVVGSYLFIVFTTKWVQKKTIDNLKYVLGSFIILQGVGLYQKYESINLNEFVVFNKNKNTVIGIKERNILTVSKKMNLDASRILKDYTTGREINKVDISDDISSLYTVNDKNILVIDSSSTYTPLSFEVHKVLLTYSPKINLERLINLIKPTLIIADASNYKSYVKHWEKTCSNRNVSFHYTVKDGAYIEKW